MILQFRLVFLSALSVILFALTFPGLAFSQTDSSESTVKSEAAGKLEDAGTAETEEVVVETFYIKSPSQVITKSPGGGKIGEIYINTPVKKVKDSGSWTQISVNAWVRSSALVTKSKRKNVAKLGFDPGSIKIIDFSTRLVKEGVPSTRAYLTLRLKNVGEKPVYSWQALLVAQSGGDVLFRETISDDTTKLPAGGSRDVNFYWEEQEKPFAYIADANKDEINFSLFKIKINR